MEFSDKVINYLNIPEQERDVIEGATLLLQANGNRILHANIVRNPAKYAAKLWYELDKYARVYLARKMANKVADLNTRTALVDLEPTRATGQRADHDQLPAEIQQLWVDVLPITNDIRAYHAKLKATRQACDRVEYMELLVALDDKRRDMWEQYDNYELNVVSEIPTPAPTVDRAPEAPAPVAEIEQKEVNAARAYISKNKGKLATLQADDPTAYLSLLEKVQDRIDLLVKAEAELTEDYIAELTALGVAF